MASRIRNSRRQVLRTSVNNATIMNGRADFVMTGNKIIFLQTSKDGTVSEIRVNLADATFRRLSDSIDAMLKNKVDELTELVESLAAQYKVKRKRLTLAQRLANMEATKNRKLGLIA